MMDVNGCFEQRMQRYEALLHEAEENRSARELQAQNNPKYQSVVAAFWNTLSQILFPEVAIEQRLIRPKQPNS